MALSPYDLQLLVDGMFNTKHTHVQRGAQWLSSRVLDSRPRGHRFEPHWCHCVVSLSENINPTLVLFQPRKACPYITERLLMGCKESNQTKKQTHAQGYCLFKFWVECAIISDVYSNFALHGSFCMSTNCRRHIHLPLFVSKCTGFR